MELAEAIHWDNGKAKGTRRSAGVAASVSVMTATPMAPRSDDRTVLDRAAQCRHGRFSCPNGGNAEEDRISGGGDGNNWTPNDRRSGEECDNGSMLPATAVNLLDSVKHTYWRRQEGGEMAE